MPLIFLHILKDKSLWTLVLALAKWSRKVAALLNLLSHFADAELLCWKGEPEVGGRGSGFKSWLCYSDHQILHY